MIEFSDKACTSEIEDGPHQNVTLECPCVCTEGGLKLIRLTRELVVDELNHHVIAAGKS